MGGIKVSESWCESAETQVLGGDPDGACSVLMSMDFCERFVRGRLECSFCAGLRDLRRSWI